MPKAFRFLIAIFVWMALVFAIYLILIPDQQGVSVTGSLAFIKYGIDSLLITFRYADGWNLLLITFLISISSIVFSINDLFITDKIFKRLTLKAKGLYQEGFVWLVKMASNSILFVIQIMLFCYVVNISVSAPNIYGSIDALPQGHKYTGLILGTTKVLKSTGTINRYYKSRIDATVDLYKKGFLTKIIISGDRQDRSYDETRDISNDLLKAGIPKSVLIIDPKGFSTLESIKRTKLYSGQEYVLIISQAFHLERAIFLAKHENIPAIGYSAGTDMTANMVKREMFAKVKVLLDIYVFNSQAEEISMFPRRAISILRITDVIIMISCLACVALSGVMVRNLIKF